MSVKLENDGSIKIPFHINRNEINKELYYLQNKGHVIKEIYTGQAGIKNVNEDFIMLTKIDDIYDPKESDHIINPMLEDGYRLSSYVYRIYTDDKVYKFVPIILMTQKEINDESVKGLYKTMKFKDYKQIFN
jgi:hypothetical protein